MPKLPGPDLKMDRIEKLAELINTAERPVIHAGGGVSISGAGKELTELAHKADIPVATTLMCLGFFSRFDPLSLGIMGMHGKREANLAVHNADLIITVGGRFSDRITGNPNKFAKGAAIVHIDIDRAEIGKNITPALKIRADIKDALTALLPLVKKQKRPDWLAQIKGWKQDDSGSPAGAFTPKAILETIYGIFGDDTIVATDVGQHQMWTAQYWPFSKPRKLITSGGMGTMGFGMGAAIGAKLANPNTQTILITGDGSFRMNMNELITISTLELPIIIFVMRNGSLGMVRQWQKLFWNKRYSSTILSDNVDYEKLPEAFGLTGYRVKTLEELGEAIEKARATKKAAVICCDICIEDNVWPIVPPGDTIENQIMEE